GHRAASPSIVTHAVSVVVRIVDPVAHVIARRIVSANHDRRIHDGPTPIVSVSPMVMVVVMAMMAVEVPVMMVSVMVVAVMMMPMATVGLRRIRESKQRGSHTKYGDGKKFLEHREPLSPHLF